MFYNTPWGQSERVLLIAEGVAHVDLEQGPGVMFAKSVAENYLSPAALKHAVLVDDYVFFDSKRMLVPILDAKALRLQFRATYPNLEQCPKEAELDQELLKKLSEFNQDYLLDAGFRPNIDFVDRRSLQHRYEAAVREGHPSVVSFVEGDYATLLPGIVQVRSGDGQSHLATERSYQSMESNEISRITKPMSALEFVDGNGYPEFQNRLSNYGAVLAQTYDRQIEENSEAARLELAEGHWGPRQTFGHLLNDAVSRIETYAQKNGIDPIEPIIQAQLQEIYEQAHPELRGAFPFARFLWQSEQKLGPQLLEQAEGDWSSQRQEQYLGEKESVDLHPMTI